MENIIITLPKELIITGGFLVSSLLIIFVMWMDKPKQKEVKQ